MKRTIAILTLSAAMSLTPYIIEENTEGFVPAVAYAEASNETKVAVADFVPRTPELYNKLGPNSKEYLKDKSIKVLPNPAKWKVYSTTKAGYVRWYDPESIKVLKTGDTRLRVNVCFYKPDFGYVIANYLINYTQHYWSQMDSAGYSISDGKLFQTHNDEVSRNDYLGKQYKVDPQKVGPYSHYGYFKKFVEK